MRYPLLFDLRDKNILFVGGGNVAVRRIEALKKTGARITVVTREASEKICGCRIILKEFEENDINSGYFMIFVCTNSKETNIEAANCAKNLRIPVNIADNPELSDFHMPSVIDTYEYTLSISTKDANPSKAKSLREKLELFLKNSK